MNRTAYLKNYFILIILVALSSASFAQTTDCYPNSTVSFDVIERERIPSITSVEAIGTQCRVDADKKLAEYRKEDEKNFNFLKNKYFAALSGWVQTGDCEHGGPPPCCTAPSASVPWAVVGAEKAKAALMAEWHKEQSKRQHEVEKMMHDCLADLKSAGINKFNDLYAQANDCLKGIQANKVVADYNKDLVVGYVNQLNDIHAQMQAMAAIITPDPTAIALLNTTMQKLQADICAKLTQLNNPVKKDPTTASGARAQVEKPKVESQAITNSTNQQTQQKAVYQQNADNYVNAANNSTEDIQKAMNLNLAKINAAAGGNKAQVTQIQQAQNQQLTQGVSTLIGQLNQLYNQPVASTSVYNRIQNQYDAAISDLDGHREFKSKGRKEYEAGHLQEALTFYMQSILYILRSSYNDIDINGMQTGTEVSIGSYFPKVSSNIRDYVKINVPIELPDIYYLPLCHCYTGLSYNRPLDSAFFYLRDSKKCKALYYAGSSYTIKTKKVTDNIDEVMALKNLTIAMSTFQLKTSFDVIDYYNAVVWIAYLENKNAKTASDLLNGVDHIYTYMENLKKNIREKTVKIEKYDTFFLQPNNMMLKYFGSIFYYRLFYTTNDEDMKNHIVALIGNEWHAQDMVFFPPLDDYK